MGEQSGFRAIVVLDSCYFRGAFYPCDDDGHHCRERGRRVDPRGCTVVTARSRTQAAAKRSFLNNTHGPIISWASSAGISSRGCIQQHTATASSTSLALTNNGNDVVAIGIGSDQGVVAGAVYNVPHAEAKFVDTAAHQAWPVGQTRYATLRQSALEKKAFVDCCGQAVDRDQLEAELRGKPGLRLGDAMLPLNEGSGGHPEPGSDIRNTTTRCSTPKIPPVDLVCRTKLAGGACACPRSRQPIPGRKHGRGESIAIQSRKHVERAKGRPRKW